MSTEGYREVKYPDVSEDSDILDWTDFAACKGEKTEDFYVLQCVGEKRRIKERERCKKIIAKYCMKCLYTQNCLQRAINTNDRNMIMGGTTPAERRHLMPKMSKKTV